MKLNILKLLSNNKLGFLIILIISILFSYYIYSIEDKVNVYKEEIYLPKQTNIYHAHLSNTLHSAVQVHKNEKGFCEVDINNEINKQNTILQLTIKNENYKTTIENLKNKNFNISILKCESIIKLTLENFLKFYDEVSIFLKDSNMKLNNENSELNNSVNSKYFNEQAEIAKQKFFVKYVLDNFSTEKLDMSLVYAPAKIYQHIFNGIITLVILLAVYVGVLVANKNIKKN